MEVKILKSKFMKSIMQQNTYVVLSGGGALIIDAGAEIADVEEVLGGAKVEAILMTHLHFDHFWNIEDYISKFNCDVYVCAGAEIKFEDYEKNGSLLVRNQITRKIQPKNVKYYQNELKFNNFDVKIYFTPGHCGDCVCILIDDCLFSGDTLFAEGIGRTDLFDSSDDDMKKSLQTIRAINFEKLYPGHYAAATKQQADAVIDYYL